MSAAKEGRRIFVGGNWKSNGTKSSIVDLVSKLNTTQIPSNVDVVVAPTFIHLDYVNSHLTKSIGVSAQTCSAYKQGAYTGEVSADQLKDAGIHWVIIGHSERRQLFGATDEVVGKKVSIALANQLKVIACVGETLDERKSNKTMDVIIRQLEAIGANVKTNEWNNVVIAYEPVWAIGTGVVATPQQAQEVHADIRKWLSSKYGAAIASSVRVIYGGSVKGSNSDELIREKDIDGFLVGGASLVADDFAKIIQSPTRSKL